MARHEKQKPLRVLNLPLNPHIRPGAWLTNHRQYYDRAHVLLARVTLVADQIVNTWPAGAGDAIEVDQNTDWLYELCEERNALGDSVVLFSAMSVEAFLNYYGVVRLGETAFYQHFEWPGPERKLRLLLLNCDGLSLEPEAPLVMELRALVERRNELAHPKARETRDDITVEERMGKPLPESAGVALEHCTRFFQLFRDAVPAASSLTPALRTD